MRLLILTIIVVSSIVSLHGQEKYKLVQYPDLEEGITVYDILLRENGSVYIGSDRGLFFINSFEEAPKSILRNVRITSMCAGEGNSFFFGGNNAFGHSGSFRLHYLKDKKSDILCMTIHGNSLWIGTNNGLYEINKRNFSASKHYTIKNSKLPSPVVNFLYSDKYDVLWAGTQKGVLRIDGNSWKAWERVPMDGIYENREGLWLLSNEELWNIDNINGYNRWYEANLKDGLKKGKVNDIVIDSEDRLIIASDVLVRFNPYTDKIERYGKDLGLISQKCLSIEIDDEDKLWIGTEKQGLFTVGFKDRERIRKKYVPMEFALIGKSPSCFDQADGSLKLNLKGGKKPYTISWSSGENDVKKVYGLKSGRYEVTVVDAENDKIVESITLKEPEKLSLSLGNVIIDEFGSNKATVEFAYSGGNPGYILEIDGISAHNPAGKISPGKHTATITDILGCQAVLVFEIEGETTFTQLSAEDIEVGQVVRINKLFFATDSTNITRQAVPVLDDVYTFLVENPNIIIEVGGHTNGLPPHEYCDKLSTERAKNVAEHLVNRGIDIGRISFKGYGKRRPVASNKTTEGRKKNQRVEIKILSIGE